MMWAVTLVLALLAQVQLVHLVQEAPLLFPPLRITAPRSRDKTCAEHSQQLESALANHTLWAMQMLDSSAVSAAVGTLTGSVYQLGDFDQCVGLSEPWPAQYCLATVRYQVPHTGARPLHHQKYDPWNSVWDKIHYPGEEYMFPLDEISWGICVPASCSAAEMQFSLQEYLQGTARALSSASAVDIKVQHCTEPLKKIYTFDFLDGAFIFFLGLLGLLLFGGTLLDLWPTKGVSSQSLDSQSPARAALICFSLKRSLQAFLADDPRPQGLNMDPVSGVRFINMVLLVCVHHILNVFRGPVHNYLDVADAVEDVMLTGVIHGQLFVDSCFYLAGLLLAFHDLSRSRAVSFGRSLLLRYIRLTPAYALIILFYASLLYKVGSGPVWDHFMAVERVSCRDYWWANLLYINNYAPTDTLCMFQSWSLAADMHYFILGSLVLLVARRRFRVGVALLAGLFVLSVALPFALTAVQRWPAMLMFHPGFLKDIHRSPMFRVMYSASHNRASPYLMGMGLAMLLHSLHKRNYRFSPKWTWTLEVIATLCTCSALFTSVIFYDPGHKYDAFEAASYASLTPVCWTTGLVLGSLSSMLGTKSMVRFATTPKPFLVMSKLTYCVYLVHWIYQMTGTAVLRAPYHQSNFKTMLEAGNDVLNSFVLAFALHLAVETPTRMLAKRFLTPSRGGRVLYAMTPNADPAAAKDPADANGNVLKTDHRSDQRSC